MLLCDNDILTSDVEISMINHYLHSIAAGGCGYLPDIGHCQHLPETTGICPIICASICRRMAASAG